MPEFIETLHGYIFDVDRLPIAMIALLLVTLGGVIRGALGGNANPFFWHLMDILFGNLGSRMNKPGRLRGDLIFRGFLFSIFAIAVSFLLGRMVEAGSAIYPFWSIIEILGLSILLTSGRVLAALGRLYRALNEEKVTEGAYYTIARSTRTDLSRSDDFTITRVGMGLALKSFDKGMVAPIVWYLIAGLPGAYLYAGLAALCWRFGGDGHVKGFGEAPMSLERLMGFIPNMLSGVLMAFAGLLTPTAGMARAFLGFFTSKGTASYGEGGFPVTTAAFALNVSLGGPTTDLDGVAIKRGWVGPEKATAQLVAKHLHRVVYMSFMAHLLLLAALIGAMVFAGGGV